MDRCSSGPNNSLLLYTDPTDFNLGVPILPCRMFLGIKSAILNDVIIDTFSCHSTEHVTTFLPGQWPPPPMWTKGFAFWVLCCLLKFVSSARCGFLHSVAVSITAGKAITAIVHTAMIKPQVLSLHC